MAPPAKRQRLGRRVAVGIDRARALAVSKHNIGGAEASRRHCRRSSFDGGMALAKLRGAHGPMRLMLIHICVRTSSPCILHLACRRIDVISRGMWLSPLWQCPRPCALAPLVSVGAWQ